MLNAPTYLVMIVLFAVLAGLVRSWPFAVFSAIAFYVIWRMNQWEQAMYTLALVLLAAAIAVVLAVRWASGRPGTTVSAGCCDRCWT